MSQLTDLKSMSSQTKNEAKFFKKKKKTNRKYKLSKLKLKKSELELEKKQNHIVDSMSGDYFNIRNEKNF